MEDTKKSGRESGIEKQIENTVRPHKITEVRKSVCLDTGITVIMEARDTGKAREEKE